MNLFAELRRRSIFRVAGAYVVVSWVLAQAAVLLETSSGLPGWFDGFVVALLVLGFPVALILAWAFELTPEGVKRTAPASDAPARSFTAADIVIAAALVAVLGGVVYQSLSGRGRALVDAEAAGPVVASAVPTIAVLPFADMSPGGDQEYFSDGLSEELLNQLAQLEGLRVIARTSSFAFKGENADVRTIGDALSADHILEGSVRKSGDRLRITAQLIEAASGVHLWSETYDRDLDDVFAIQDDIAVAVAEELRIALDVGEAPQRFGGTSSVEAYDLYLRGRALGRAATSFAVNDMWEQSIALLRRAVEIDPRFAQAWVELAYSSSLLASNATSPPEAERARAEMELAAFRALEIAPDLWEAEGALGALRLSQGRWLEAHRALERARELAERAGADMGQTYWNYQLQAGWLSQSRESMEASLRSDPLSSITPGALENVGYLLDPSSEPAGADETALGALLVGLKAIGDGDVAEVRALAEGAAGTDDATAFLFTELAPYLEGDADAFGEWLEGRESLSRGQLVIVAAAAARLGDDELAVDLLRRAYFEIESATGYWMVWVPAFRGVRGTDAFEDLLRDIGLVELWRETGEWGDFCRPLGPDAFECE